MCLVFLKVYALYNTEEDLVNIRQPLEDLNASLKYLPIESFFNSLPEEMRTHILGYLCDGGAFLAASVCQHWKKIVKRRFILSLD